MMNCISLIGTAELGYVTLESVDITLSGNNIHDGTLSGLNVEWINVFSFVRDVYFA